MAENVKKIGITAPSEPFAQSSALKATDQLPGEKPMFLRGGSPHAHTPHNPYPKEKTAFGTQVFKS